MIPHELNKVYVFCLKVTIGQTSIGTFSIIIVQLDLQISLSWKLLNNKIEVVKKNELNL